MSDIAKPKSPADTSAPEIHSSAERREMRRLFMKHAANDLYMRVAALRRRSKGTEGDEAHNHAIATALLEIAK